MRTFETTARTGFALLVLLLAAGMAYSVRQLSSAAESQMASLRDEEREITLVERLRWSAEIVVSSGRGYLISGDPELLARLQEARLDFEESVRALRGLALSQRGLQLTAEAERAAGDFMRVQEELLRARQRSEGPELLVRRFEAELLPLRLELDQALARLVEHKGALLQEHYAEAREDRIQLAAWLYGLLGFLVLTGFGIARYFTSRIGVAYRQEQQALEAAQKALAARDELMGIVAHDLRNPLGAITIKAALLRRGAGSEKTRRQAESIENVAMRMEYLVKTMLDVTTIEAGQFSVSPAPCGVGDLLRESAEMFGSLAASKQVRLEQRLEEPGLAVQADRERVLQVLSNLLGNALKFTPPGGQVTVSVDRQGAMVRFGVLDTGPGISRENLPRVFDRFWKAEAPGKKGTGLGLFIARGIVAAHGGRIWAEGEVGSGTRFYFTLPEAAPEERRVSSAEPPAPPQSA